MDLSLQESGVTSTPCCFIIKHSTKEEQIYITCEIVLELQLAGQGFSAAQKIFSILNLHGPVSTASWTAHTRTLEEAVNEFIERDLQNAALQVNVISCRLAKLRVSSMILSRMSI